MSMDKCIDNRFEIIDKAKRLLIENTNITDAPDEMKVLYSILYRCWQMGWLDRLDRKPTEDGCTLTTEEVAYIDRTIADLESENAKLRELARVFYHCTTSGECDECPVNGGGAVHLMPDTICDTMHDRMRELGVDA